MGTRTAAYVLRHLSICMHLHDSGRDGHVCQRTEENMSGVETEQLGMKRREDVETTNAGEIRLDNDFTTRSGRGLGIY